MTNKKRIVLVDDEIKLLTALRKSLEIVGHEVTTFTDPRAALRQVVDDPPDLVVSDIRMPGLSGLELLAQLQARALNVPVILMTAFSSVETAVQAIKLGACDYLMKPFHLADLEAAVDRVFSAAPGEEAPTSTSEMVGRSAAIEKVRDLVAQVAPTDSTVLIQGESGTGKELVARILHDLSARRDKAFVPINCSTLPEGLLESELFGHVKGSFTGAVGDKDGLFAAADGGSLFLDEIADLSPAGQVKLLRVLQDGQFKRVGDTKARSSDVRVIVASNKDLRVETAGKRFREDLYYRLNVITVLLPPLRDRPEDIPPLVEHLLARFTARYRKPHLRLDDAAMARLLRHPWPGNVRELENVIERAVILERRETIGADMLALDGVAPVAGATPDPAPVVPLGDDVSLTDSLERLERDLINRALARSNGNHSRAAALLGVTRQNLHYKLKKYRLGGPPQEE